MITVNKNGNEEQYIYAKDLHEALELSEANYTAWVKRHLLNNPAVSEGKGYKRRANRWPNASYKEYGLSLDFAITLATKSRSSKSEEVTTYLLQAETKENTNMEHFDTEVEEKVEEPKVKETSMELIIPIFKSVIGEDKEEVNSVSARELHEGLESKRQFADWVKAKVIDNEFLTEGEDWISLHNVVKRASTRAAAGGNNKKEYALTLDAAKKVAMSEQTAKGNEVRTYFIKKEKEANDPTQKATPPTELLQEERNLRSFKTGLEIAKLANKEGDLAVSAANAYTMHYQGEDVLRIMCIKDIVTKDKEVYYDVRTLAGKLGIQYNEFNRLLVVAGLQKKSITSPMGYGGNYLPTEKGKIYCYADDGGVKDKGMGYPKLSLKWTWDVLPQVNTAHFEEIGKVMPKACPKVESKPEPEPKPESEPKAKIPPVETPASSGEKEEEKAYNPTELGNILGISGRRMNQVLEAAGFQNHVRDRNGNSCWAPTNKAQGLCWSKPKSQSTEGVAVFNLFWFEAVLSEINPHSIQNYAREYKARQACYSRQKARVRV